MSEMLAYLSHAEIPSRSANSVHVMKMCDGFAQAGYAVTLVTRQGSDGHGLTPAAFYGTSPDVRMEFVAEHPTPLGRVLFSWTGALRSYRAGARWAFGRDLAGCYFAGLLGLPVAHETHSPASLLRGAKRFMFERLIGSARFQKLVVITDTLKMSYEQEFRLAAERILVLPDAASEPTANVREADVPTLPESGRLSVGYVGHLYSGKGMEIIAALAPSCDWAEFHVVGGRDEDIRFWKDHCGGQRNIRFHGFVPHGQLDTYLVGFDVVVAPLQERVTVEGKGDISTFTSPLKLFEYMAARKAIVCSDLPVLHEILQHNENCIFVPPADIGAWRAALLCLRDDPDRRMRLGENACRGFHHRYTWRARADRVMAALRSRS